MYVKTIKWIDQDSNEAEVMVSDGCIELLCFSHPFKKNINEKLEEPIHCFNVDNVVIARDKTSCVNKSSSYFGYSLCGKLVDRNSKLVYLGNIKLCLENAYISNDILEGNYVEFDVSRLDIY